MIRIHREAKKFFNDEHQHNNTQIQKEHRKNTNCRPVCVCVCVWNLLPHIACCVCVCVCVCVFVCIELYSPHWTESEVASPDSDAGGVRCAAVKGQSHCPCPSVQSVLLLSSAVRSPVSSGLGCCFHGSASGAHSAEVRVRLGCQ